MIYTHVGINEIFKQTSIMGSSVISYIIYFHYNNCTHSDIVNLQDQKCQLLVIIYLIPIFISINYMSVTNRHFYNFSNVVYSGNTELWHPLATTISSMKSRMVILVNLCRLRGLAAGYQGMAVGIPHSGAKSQIRGPTLSLLIFIVLLLDWRIYMLD